MKTSQNGLNLIKQFEGIELQSYQDQAGYWTIGIGTRFIDNESVKPGMMITEDQALQYLQLDVEKFENAVNENVEVDLTQNQFDALVDFTYNLGQESLINSTLLKKLNNGDYQGAANEFLRWDKAGGQVVEGLLRRRTAERELFLS